MFGDGIKILALVPLRERYHPLYFVSRAQTMIKIQADIINTSKGQVRTGLAVESSTRSPAGVGYLVNSNFWLAQGVGERGRALG